MEFIELDLTKEDVDKVEDLLQSLREIGYAHIELNSGNELVLSCKEFVRNRKEYIKNLKNLGLDEIKLNKHIEKVNKMTRE